MSILVSPFRFCEVGLSSLSQVSVHHVFEKYSHVALQIPAYLIIVSFNPAIMPPSKKQVPINRRSAIPEAPLDTFHSSHGLSSEQIYHDIRNRIHVPEEGYEPRGKETFHEAAREVLAYPPNGSNYFNSTSSLCKWISRMKDDMNGSTAQMWWFMFTRTKQLGDLSRNCVSFFLSSSIDFQPNSEDWKTIQAIGHASDAKDTYIDGLLGLCDLAYGVFQVQPTRLFLHGFLVHKERAEQWIFDRSGLYCWLDMELGDCGAQAELLGMISGSRFCGGFELGSTSLLINSLGPCNVLVEGSFDLQFEREPFHVRDTILSSGPICYFGRKPQIPPSSKPWDHVLKIKWCSDTDRHEEEFLLQAQNANVHRIANLVAHRKYESWSTTRLRQGYFQGDYRRLIRDSDSASSLAGIVQHSEPTTTPFRDLAMHCVVTTPVGRSLRSFKSLLELLVVLRDAIKAHRSLLQSARILHQDISIDNILIVDTPTGPSGILIDLDGAMFIDRGPKRPGELIGTKLFMAIDLMTGEMHSYRHDLESFLYVLLTAVITGGKRVPADSLLTFWTKGGFEESAMNKTHSMMEPGFTHLLDEIPDEYDPVEPLADRLRNILFPLDNHGGIMTGTDEARQDELYDAMIRAFEKAIRIQQRDVSAAPA